jgi:hypothetical protein
MPNFLPDFMIWHVSRWKNRNFGLYSLRIASNSKSAAYFYRVDTLWYKTERTKTERNHWYGVLG